MQIGAPGQLTPQSVVKSGRILYSFEMLWLKFDAINPLVSEIFMLESVNAHIFDFLRKQHTHLGVTISNTLSWSSHINAAIAKADRRLSVILRCQNILPRSCKDMLYKQLSAPYWTMETLYMTHV